MPRAIPFSRLLEARAAFIRALASQTDAIRELYEWRLPAQALENERERRLRERVAADSDLTGLGRDGTVREYRSDSPGLQATAGNEAESVSSLRAPAEHFDRSGFGLSREHVAELAGPDRASATIEWARRWKLGEVLWLRDWAIFALLWWGLCRSCVVPNCSRGCSGATSGDVDRALALVLSHEILRDLEYANGYSWSFVQSQTPRSSSGGRGGIQGWGVSLPSGLIPAADPMMGPHPLLETEQEFFDRAYQAWDEALSEITRQGFEISLPRKSELHCEWLVRFHVQEHTADEIVGNRSQPDPSTVYKAVRSMAQLIGLRVREDLN